MDSQFVLMCSGNVFETALFRATQIRGTSYSRSLFRHIAGDENGAARNYDGSVWGVTRRKRNDGGRPLRLMLLPARCVRNNPPVCRSLIKSGLPEGLGLVYQYRPLHFGTKFD